MRKVTVSVQVDAEKLRAIQFYTGRKQSSMEAELEDCVNKIYEKYVPAQTREYIESIAGWYRRFPAGWPGGRSACPPRCRSVSRWHPALRFRCILCALIGGSHAKDNRQRPGGC